MFSVNGRYFCQDGGSPLIAPWFPTGVVVKIGADGVVFVGAIPAGTPGKILKRRLCDQVRDHRLPIT